MNLNQDITINTSATFSNCGALALATTFIHGTIAAVTPKAVKIEREGMFCWFPKKALVNVEDLDGDVLCKVAHWFPLSHWHHRMENTSVLAG